MEYIANPIEFDFDKAKHYHDNALHYHVEGEYEISIAFNKRALQVMGADDTPERRKFRHECHQSIGMSYIDLARHNELDMSYLDKAISHFKIALKVGVDINTLRMMNETYDIIVEVQNTIIDDLSK